MVHQVNPIPLNADTLKPVFNQPCQPMHTLWYNSLSKKVTTLFWRRKKTKRNYHLLLVSVFSKNLSTFVKFSFHFVHLTPTDFLRTTFMSTLQPHLTCRKATHLDLLYSNSMCRQSSIPTSILMLLFMSGYCDSVWTTMSCSFTTSDIRLTIVTRRKYLDSDEGKF